jgi:hypothetical protein
VQAGTHPDWVAAGHVTCNIQCHGGCNRRVDFTLDTLPQDRPWSRVGWCLVCKKCAARWIVNIVRGTT